MSVVVWPFALREEMIEGLQWSTKVIRAESAEQRIALRSAPQRSFQLSHTLTDYQYSHARSLIRESQGADGFLVPDWGQSMLLGAVSSGSSVAVGVDVSVLSAPPFFGHLLMLLWESAQKFETVLLTTDGATLAEVVGDYANARLMPLWPADAPEDFSASRVGARLNQVSIAFDVNGTEDLSATPDVAYRGLDMLDECPVIGSGELEESIVWPVSGFGNSASISYLLRSRSMPDMASSMRWRLKTRADQFAFVQWLHYRSGRQKAFWMSSRGKDLEPSQTSSGTTVKVFSFPGLTGLGRTDPFDIEIKTATARYLRRVTSMTAGTPTGGRETIDMTIDTSLGVSLPPASIVRISYLRCTRFNADRVELLHQAGGGMSIQIPFIEVPTP